MDKKTPVLKCIRCNRVTGAVQNIPKDNFVCSSCITGNKNVVGMVPYDSEKHEIVNLHSFIDQNA